MIRKYYLKSTTLPLNIEGEKEISVYADRNRLEQVIINLISNAIKYSPDADKVIINVDKTGDDIKVAVTDFGIGIPNETLPFLFDRFYRVDEVSQRYSGLGLGLYISAEIVRRHQGDIGIDSTPGKGSTFWFTTPSQ
jgi:two-component system, chemotaxis family, CheB/CheR fusion protein